MTAISGVQPRPLSDSNDSLLRFAMRADATMTGLRGLAFAGLQYLGVRRLAA